MIGYIPADPISGKHLLYIIHVERDNEEYYIYYDISVGASVGWAAEKYIKTGKWLLCQRIDLLKAQAPLSYLMAAVRAEPLYKDVADLTEAKGCRICVHIMVNLGLRLVELTRQAAIRLNPRISVLVRQIGPTDAVTERRPAIWRNIRDCLYCSLIHRSECRLL